MTLDDLEFLPQGTPGLNIQAFDCGRKSVNDFFHYEAQDYQDELFGKTYYWVLPDSPSEIVAGFTVANASIFTKRLPNARQKKIGREVHHEKGLINYPSILLVNKKLIITALLALSALAGHGQTQPTTDLLGSWSGKLKVGSTSLTIVLHFEQADGYVKASLDSPDQSIVIAQL